VSNEAFQKIEAYIKSADSFLSQQNSGDEFCRAEIKDFLARAIILVIVSEYEAYVESVFVRRVEECGDKCIVNLGRKFYDRKFRSPDLSKISDALAIFDENFKIAFNNTINTEGINVSWDNILKARHAIVHKQGTLQLTFDDVKNEYLKTRKIIEALEIILFPKEIKNDQKTKT
jgi:hypothetical protein